VEAINNLAPLRNRTEVRKFIGFINYYRDKGKKRSKILAPITELTSTKEPWKWSTEQQNAFNTRKKIMDRETILAYLNFKIPFEITQIHLHSLFQRQTGGLMEDYHQHVAQWPELLYWPGSMPAAKTKPYP
jgi:hypothetical protein